MFEALPALRSHGRKPHSVRPCLEPLESRVVPSLVVPAYSSRPGAPATLYLDFNGHFEASWGVYSNVDTPAYDIDGNAGSFSDTELANIEKIWKYVAEDYAPFNLNVTTVQPSSFANGVALRVAIGGDSSWTGSSMGGVAYLNAFTNSKVNTVYVFPKNLANGNPRPVADASSHEAGHGFGLQHQSQFSGSTEVAEYYAGPGDGTAPLMGGSYATTRSLWWYGTSTSATSYQDDLAVLASSTNGFGFRSDDHGNTVGTATALTVSPMGAVSGVGLIGQMTDVDYFSFTTGAGTITLTVNVEEPFANLDARLELRDALGNVLTSADPGNSFDATITFTAGAGSYRLVVASHGISGSATSNNYGFNIGQYTISGTVVPMTVIAPAAPSNLVANATSSTRVQLTWNDNANNEAGFKIERSTGGSWSQVAVVGANVTGWQDTSVSGGVTYSYRVRATSTAGDSAYSNTASATPPADPSAPAAPSSLTASAKSKPSLRVNLTWVDQSANESGFRIQRSFDGVNWVQVGQVGANVTTFADSAVSTGNTYQYRVFAFNGVGSSGYSNTATVTVGSSGGRGKPPRHGLSAGEVLGAGTNLPERARSVSDRSSREVIARVGDVRVPPGYVTTSELTGLVPAAVASAKSTGPFSRAGLNPPHWGYGLVEARLEAASDIS